MSHGNFEFRGKGFGYLWLSIWTAVLTIVSFGILWPWAYCARQRWLATHTFIDGRQLVFKGSGLGFFATWLLILLLSVVTLGIYIPWGYCRIMRWQTNNLYFADPGDVEQF